MLTEVRIVKEIFSKVEFVQLLDHTEKNISVLTKLVMGKSKPVAAVFPSRFQVPSYYNGYKQTLEHSSLLTMERLSVRSH